jgi:hypothetical protein
VLAGLALGAIALLLAGCSTPGKDAPLFSASCQPFDPDVTHSCVISSERWSEIAELPEPPGMYRYCAWPGLLSGDYRTRYRDVDGTIHDYTDAPAQTPSFLLEAQKGIGNSSSTEMIDYRLIPRTHSCPNAPP